MRAAELALLAAGALGALASGPSANEWVYSKTPGSSSNAEDQASTWSSYEECRLGQLQSPINIVTADATSSGLLEDAIVPQLATVPILPINTGHNFQLHETSTLISRERCRGRAAHSGASGVCVWRQARRTRRWSSTARIPKRLRRG